MLREDPNRIRIVRLLEEQRCEAFCRALQDLPNDSWDSASVYSDGTVVTDDSVRVADLIHQKDQRQLLAPLSTQLQASIRPLLHQGGREKFRMSMLQLLRYRPGGFFRKHSDASRGSMDWRRYSIVCYLNSDFTGGWTSFPLLGTQVKPDPGFAALFPSWFVHQGDPVLSGEKIVLNFFLVDPTTAPEEDLI